jgi:t-SNARE complex subunit (syntaxin)
MSKKIEQHMEQTTTIANRVRSLLKETSDENKALQGTLDGGASNPNFRIRQSQHAQMTKQFMDSMNRYSSVQENYKAKYHENLKRQYLIVRPDANEEELEKIFDKNGEVEMTRQIFSLGDQKRTDAKRALDEMRERHQDIMLIEKNIIELNQLFREMSILVDQQGDLVNQIESHVDRAAHYTEQAAGEMKIAVEHQKSRLKVS